MPTGLGCLREQLTKETDMITRMHATLERYFAATNKHDVAGMIAELAEDAIVKDEAREHRGVPAIREWAEETIRKYKFRAQPTRVASENDRAAVSVSVSGDFQGSPIELTYRFKLDGQKIARLEIG
jgi:ketosteroid isomerase-like protein